MVDEGSGAKKEAQVNFGRELLRLRTLADISQRELARHTAVSHQMVGCIERAERFPRKVFAEMADAALNAHGALVELWPGSRQSHPHWFKEFLELEAEARMIQSFDVQALPGFFQTEDYASTVLGASWPPLDPTELGHLLSARMKRQRMMERDRPPLLTVVLEETVLRRPIGGVDVMTAQLDQLETTAKNPFVQIQVLPFDRGVHPALDGAFVLLDMGKGERLAYVEGPGSGQVIANPAEVEEYEQRFGTLRTLALSPAESLNLIARYKEEHSGTQPAKLA